MEISNQAHKIPKNQICDQTIITFIELGNSQNYENQNVENQKELRK